MTLKLEELLDEFGHECSLGNEYDNRERIKAARGAVLEEVRRIQALAAHEGL